MQNKKVEKMKKVEMRAGERKETKKMKRANRSGDFAMNNSPFISANLLG